jgi:hypothetical protein
MINLVLCRRPIPSHRVGGPRFANHIFGQGRRDVANNWSGVYRRHDP